MDWPIKISVNGKLVNTISFLKESTFCMAVMPGTVHLHAKMSFRSAKLDFEAIPGREYHVTLVYNRFWGSITFVLANM